MHIGDGNISGIMYMNTLQGAIINHSTELDGKISQKNLGWIYNENSYSFVTN